MYPSLTPVIDDLTFYLFSPIPQARSWASKYGGPIVGTGILASYWAYDTFIRNVSGVVAGGDFCLPVICQALGSGRLACGAAPMHCSCGGACHACLRCSLPRQALYNNIT